MDRRKAMLSLLLAAALVSMLAGDALARRYYGRGRGRGGNYMRAQMIAAVQAQVAYARAVQRDAEARAAIAQGAVDSANQRISSARESLSSAESEERKAHEALVEAEASVISAAGEDSEIAQAKKKLDDLRQSLQYEQSRVLNSAAYQDKIKASAGTPEHAALVPKIRTEFLGNDGEYQKVLTKYELAKQDFSRLRAEVVKKDQTWLSHSSEIKEAWTSERTATNAGIAGGMQKLPAKQTLHEAQRTAATARMYVAQGEMILRALGGRTGTRQNPNTPTTSPSSSFFSQ